MKLLKDPNLDIELEPVNHHSYQTLQSFGWVQKQRKPVKNNREKQYNIS
jgi:hypothetical protein